MSDEAKVYVYVVFGRTGEYSDQQEWPVRAFRTAEAAQALQDRCNAYAQEGKRRDLDWDERDQYCAGNPEDPSMQMDYTGTEYLVYTIPFDETPSPEKP